MASPGLHVQIVTGRASPAQSEIIIPCGWHRAESIKNCQRGFAQRGMNGRSHRHQRHNAFEWGLVGLWGSHTHPTVRTNR
jgi:hypothetical protein